MGVVQDGARRALDVAVAGAALVATLPVMAAAAVVVRRSSPGPVLHRSVRVGRGSVPFVLYKIRTMYVGADTAGPGITVGHDPRVTPVGHLLRRSKVDELPQMLNVLRGDMSLVGPRPEDPRYVATYDDRHRCVLAVRPGLTSPASVAFRHEQELLAGVADSEAYYVGIVLPRKLDMDLEYLRQRTLRSDLRVLAATVRVLVTGPTPCVVSSAARDGRRGRVPVRPWHERAHRDPTATASSRVM